MKDLGKRLFMTATAVALVLGLAACDVTPGGACSQKGSLATNKDGSSYVCTTTPDGKNIWQPAGNAPVKKDRP